MSDVIGDPQPATAWERAFRRSLKGFLQAWLALFLAFPVAGMLALTAPGWIRWAQTGRLYFYGPTSLVLEGAQLLFGLALVVGPLFVLFRHFIVRPTFPYLRWGFLPVISVVPVVFFGLDMADGQSLGEAFLTEGLTLVFAAIPLLACTLLFVAIARPLGGFGDAWQGRAARRDVPEAT